MGLKTLKRRTLIRESDFYRIRARALRLYDRVEFTPVSCKEIEQEYMLNILAGDPNKHRDSPPNLQYPRSYLRTIKNKLYDSKYAEWLSYQDNDLIYVKSRGNARPSCLGWARFERDYL